MSARLVRQRLKANMSRRAALACLALFPLVVGIWLLVMSAVDGGDPTNAISHPSDGARDAHKLRLLAFPFLGIGIGFSLAFFRDLVRRRNAPAISIQRLGPTPRRIGVLNGAAVVAGSACGSGRVAVCRRLLLRICFVRRSAVLLRADSLSSASIRRRGTRHANHRVAAARTLRAPDGIRVRL